MTPSSVHAAAHDQQLFEAVAERLAVDGTWTQTFPTLKGTQPPDEQQLELLHTWKISNRRTHTTGTATAHGLWLTAPGSATHRAAAITWSTPATAPELWLLIDTPSDTRALHTTATSPAPGTDPDAMVQLLAELTAAAINGRG